MGATLLILARHFVQRPWELRRIGLRIGTLYAVNLFGAVAGAFFAGFVFLPSLGLRWTNVTAASFNLTLAAAILIARRLRPDAPAGAAAPAPSFEEVLERADEDGEVAGAPALPPQVDKTAAARRVAMIGFAVSG